ncbi:MAG TPA: Ig-like domain-containing protein [Terracidiphilus sp.]|jgi:hypothetical protein|nr:Ig-like domain-containing protein [Terracidiphilus sp.]
MRYRSLLGALLITGVLIPITSCISSPSLTSITVSPSVMNFGGPGLHTQLTAIGTYTRPNHAPVTRDLTSQVNWASATPECVTVSSSGFIESQQNICSGILITASSQGFHGIIQGSMTVNVTQPGAAGTDVTQVLISPANPAPIAVAAVEQFAASGFTGAGNPVTLTNPVSWTSSNTGVATIDQTGRATAVAAGSTTITGAYTNPDGSSAIPGTAILSVQ